MNNNLLAIVKQLIASYGENILDDPQRLKAFFSDLAKDEPKPLRIAFGRCIESGAYNALKTAPDAAERGVRKTAIAQQVRDEHGLDITLCAEALDILESGLYGAVRPKQPVCKTCGKELQEGWKACPYCGATAGNTAPSLSPQISTAEMVWINGGTFTMGSPVSEPGRNKDEGPQHQVRVSLFYIGKYDVTQREWIDIMGSNPSRFTGDKLPVETISWYDAIDYCNRRSQREGLTPAYTIDKGRRQWVVTWNKNANGYRLPTEAEWEYACRAGTTTPFHTGNNITTDQANYDGSYPYDNNAGGVNRKKTWEVGSGAANAWGLYDMHGNVWEWCWDWYGKYSSGAQADPTGAVSGSSRVARGGSWFINAQYLRSAFRYYNTPSSRNSNYGFRLVRPGFC